MTVQRARFRALPVILSLLVGCRASVGADAKVSESNASAEGDAELHGSAAEQPEGKGEMVRAPDTSAGIVGVSSGAVPSGKVLLGARHDLTLRSGPGVSHCACLAVALGQPDGAPMQWSGEPPAIDPGTQLSFALSSEGQTCTGEPKNSRGASYWGYRISGNDVIVLVEAARDGRPLTSGAIIPKPVGSGQVYVAPASRKLPYGRGKDGSARCSLGNPGAPRVSAFTELELGTNAALHPATSSNETDAPDVGSAVQ